MIYSNIFVVLLVAAACTANGRVHSRDQATKVADDELLNIEVYYESLCPDCQNFVTLQLYPTWKKLGKYFNPDLKPFGKAEATPNESSSHPGYNFVCQHGLTECTGNMWQACFLSLPGFTRDEQLDVVHCINGGGHAWDSGAVNDQTLRCMNEFGIDHATMKAAYDCVNSSEGMDLLKTLGDETNSLDPKLSFVPWLTFNGEFQQEWQDGGIEDLEALLCKNFLQDKPECQSYFMM